MSSLPAFVATFSHFHLNVVRIGFDLRFLTATFCLLGLTSANNQVFGSSVEKVSPWSSSTLVVFFKNTSFTLSFTTTSQLYRPHTRYLPRSCKLQLCLPLHHLMFRAIVSRNLLPPLKSVWCMPLSTHRPYPWLSFFRKFDERMTTSTPSPAVPSYNTSVFVLVT